MELKNLMSGIAVVIDDAIENTAADEEGKTGSQDTIVQIVERIGEEWNLPFYKVNELPPERTWPNLLQAASFILLDWRLWPSGASQLKRAGIKKNIQFLEQAQNHFVPVFIFTNESIDDVENELPLTIYRRDSPEKNFVFIRQKANLLSDGSLDSRAIEEWIRGNASVYALKTWEQVFHDAKKELFSLMYARSPDWPKVFWKAYSDDGVDPSSSLTNLINDSLQGRMLTNGFEGIILDTPPAEVSEEDLRALIGEVSVRPQKNLLPNEIRCGDLFKHGGKYLLNIRPDCDCVPRQKNTSCDDVELYCIEGDKMSESQIQRQPYQDGHFHEKLWENVSFSIHDGKSVRFKFKKIRIEKYSNIKDDRIGRLLHPYLTRIQQRFALYLQRQGLPRIPEAAVPRTEDSNDTSCDMGDRLPHRSS